MLPASLPGCVVCEWTGHFQAWAGETRDLPPDLASPRDHAVCIAQPRDGEKLLNIGQT